MEMGPIMHGDQANLKTRCHLVPCRFSAEAIGLSMHPNRYPSIHETNKPKNLNPTSYQVVAYFTLGEEGSPAQPTPKIIFVFILMRCF